MTALRGVNRSRIFPVLLGEDLACDSDQLLAKWQQDRASQERRRMRYQAAGEYLAVTSHLLVAIWNGEREPGVGNTSPVVEARLNGPSPGLLPTSSAIPYPHGGPVWHLYVPRCGASSPANHECLAMQGTVSPPQPLRILHPYYLTGECLQAPLVGALQPTDHTLESDRLRMLARVGECLRNFNEQRVPSPRDPDKEFTRALNDPVLEQALQAESPEFARGLRGVIRARCRAAGLSQSLQKMAKSTLSWLVWLTFFAAVLLHGFSHGIPHHASEPPSNAARSEEHGPVSTPQLIYGWLSLALAAAALGFFGVQRARQLEQRGHDARAIAEGLRVQFYWNLAGLGKSVSANYMSRHRSELDWVRGVIRSTSTPYHYWSDWFRSLRAPLRIRALRAVQTAWVQDQLGYFRNASHREHHQLHTWHKLGGAAALAGVLTFLGLVARDSGRALSDASEILMSRSVCLGALALAVCISLARARSQQLAAARSGRDDALYPELWHLVEGKFKRWPSDANWKVRWQYIARWANAAKRLVVPVLFELVNVLVPSSGQPAKTRTRFATRLRGGVANFLLHLPIALLITCAAGMLAQAAEHWVPYAPSEIHLRHIVGGTLLLAGALSVAWAEKNLLSEQAYQYNTMAALYHVANQRLTCELAALEQIDPHDTDQLNQSVARVQLLLFNLGKEALDENAEWLLLHRGRNGRHPHFLQAKKWQTPTFPWCSPLLRKQIGRAICGVLPDRL